MFKSLTVRMWLTFVAVTLLVLLVISLGVTIVQIQGYNDYLNRTEDSALAGAVANIRGELNAGKSLAVAAHSASDRLGYPGLYLTVYYRDRLVFLPDRIFADPANWSPLDRVSVIVNTIEGFPTREVFLNDRRFAPFHPSVYVTPAFNTYLPDLVFAALRRMLPFMALSGVLACAFAWFIARRAIRPLLELSRDLNALGRGELNPKALEANAATEIARLTASYNLAVENAQRAAADRASAMENVRNFISDASHELRTPLTIIMGYIDVVAQGLVIDPADAERVLNKTLAECRRMRNTIEKLISLARLDREDSEIGTVDVASMVRDVAESMKSLSRDRLQIDVPIDGEALVSGNESEIREALVNVVDNAVKYAPGSPIDIRVTKNSDVVVVEIADAGPGMAAEDRDRAFERFHRGNSHVNVQGSGLGLAIAKRAVQRAKGRITLRSEPAQGTAVRFYLPSVSRTLGATGGQEA